MSQCLAQISNADILIPVAKRKSLFDDRPVEINELTYVIKQDLSSLNAQISSLQTLTRSQNSRTAAEQEGEHNKNACADPWHVNGVLMPN